MDTPQNGAFTVIPGTLTTDPLPSQEYTIIPTNVLRFAISCPKLTTAGWVWQEGQFVYCG